jgi:hypothetical protein
MIWAFIFAGFFFLLVIEWPTSLNALEGLIVALAVTSAISFRDSNSTSRIVETCLIGVVAISLIVLPLGDPTALGRNVLITLSIAPIFVGLTAAGPLVKKSRIARCSWREAGVACLFAMSVPVAAWLLRTGISDIGAESLTVLLAAAIVGERLVPWFHSEMETLTKNEESHAGVITDPRLSVLARRVAFRGKLGNCGH